ncbi:MAG: LysE type translocator [Syntrophus sp. PtaU1.Bin208]|nr:MAG: LysE type translocator [Syntrophus sp. PtaU1.Bin208]
MLALITIFFSSFVIALSGAMMPGPMLTATISESTRRGFWTGPLLVAGHGVLELVLLVALMVGLAPLLLKEGVFAAIALAGSVILLWMAYGIFRSLPSLSLAWQDPGENQGRLMIYGVLLSLSNPYWYIWWATIGLGYIVQCRVSGIAGIAVFFAGHIIGDLAFYAFVSGAVAKGRSFLSDRLYRNVLGGCGVFLVCFAFYFAFVGLQKILS